MKSWFTLAFTTLFSLFSLQSYADSFDLALSNELVEIEFEADFSNAYAFDLSYLHSIYEDRSKNLTSAGFYARTENDVLRAKLGGKFIWVNTSDSNTYGLALGGSIIGYVIPKLWLGGEAYYSPNILLGGDYSTFYDISANIGYDVMEHATVYLGYRNLAADEDKNTLGVYKGFQLGFRFRI
ncbi:Uncharacterised protein [BD1-7 clade bacterium]|uniref:Outer membrane protein beta-barrel domain-containing protein n=1 Tax=BD1-7 clade bacterium TaxID=2029982 RepID=A0A5S9PCW0_9GAMM|nr:Uncharacterised protein [BD1-7 clade bacterium]